MTARTHLGQRGASVRNFRWVGGACLAAILLAGCITVEPRRTNLTFGEACNATSKNDSLVELESTPWAHCALQTHAIPAVPKKTWKLAFLEFGDDGRMLKPGQRELLLKQFDDHQRNYVVYFVHGWRHDSAIGDGDVQRFRTIMEYIGSFIAQRCRTSADPQCRATLTGVFVSWPAREVNETSIPKDLATLAAGPSFLIVNSRSDRIAADVLKSLTDLQTDIKAKDPGERSLLLAHSAGANIVLRGMMPALIAHLRDWSIDRSRPLTLPLWDEVVLFNPASEAANWIRLQDEVRKLKGDNANPLRPEIFPNTQPPLILSFSSACGPDADYGSDEPARARPYNVCDTPVDVLFPAAQKAMLKFRKDRTVALGHYYDRALGHGATHTVADDSDQPPGVPTSADSSNAHSRCDPAPSWLYVTRRAVPGEAWDSGGTFPRAEPRSLAGRDLVTSDGIGKTISRQYRMGGLDQPPITTPNDPFWNLRGAGQVIQDHGAYVSYPLLCSIFQIWEDGVATQPRGATGP